MNPIIKLPGGKSRELDRIKYLIPEHKRYVEPFFGGGALFFDLIPKKAAINDISGDLMRFYRLVKAQDQDLHHLLRCYCNSFCQLNETCREEALELVHLFFKLKEGFLDKDALSAALKDFIDGICTITNPDLSELVLDPNEFALQLHRMVQDKFLRTVDNYDKKPFSTQDLCENLITGFTGGYYMYFRKVFNDIQLGRIEAPSEAYRAANFYFVREYCYGSMFRYNASGEFNIPYGGMSYNQKDMGSKIDRIFRQETAELFADTEIHCCDFLDFFEKINLCADDFLFLDPPYDTDFSDYEGKDFTKYDQERLANALKNTPAKFVLIIKNTEFIHKLYSRDFHILTFDKQYTYNVRSRNERDAEHLIITNFPV